MSLLIDFHNGAHVFLLAALVLLAILLIGFFTDEPEDALAGVCIFVAAILILAVLTGIGMMVYHSLR